MSILVVLEQRGGKWNRVSLEAITAAMSIGAPVDAVVIGASIGESAREAAKYPVARVFTIEDSALAEYTAEGWTFALEQLIQSIKPSAVVFPHTYQVRDYAPRLATRSRRVLLSDVIGIHDGLFVRQLFQGKLNAEIRPVAEPVFVSVQAGAFAAAAPAETSAEIVPFRVQLAGIHSKPEAPFRESQRAVDLSAANMIVAVGRGIKEKDNLHIVEDLAQALGAELAASRPICDNGWLPMERQVGSSGQTVAPKLYVAVGISGAIQHLVGMKGSKTVVAINKDENAPVFESADYGIVGDLFEVVPAVVDEIKKAKA